MVATLVNKFFLILFIVAFFFSHCKKKEDPAYIIEKVPATFTLGFFSQQDFIKTPTGFDTTLSLYTTFIRHFDKPSPSDSYLLNYSASCNSVNTSTIINSPNINAFTSSAHWHASSTEIGEIDYTDMSPTPSFTNSNWWSADSIQASQNFVIDFSSFKDYSQIIVDYGNSYLLPLQINYPLNQVTIPANGLSNFSRPHTINIWVQKYLNIPNGNKTLNFTKILHFQIHTIVY